MLNKIYTNRKEYLYNQGIIENLKQFANDPQNYFKGVVNQVYELENNGETNRDKILTKYKPTIYTNGINCYKAYIEAHKECAKNYIGKQHSFPAGLVTEAYNYIPNKRGEEENKNTSEG